MLTIVAGQIHCRGVLTNLIKQTWHLEYKLYCDISNLSMIGSSFVSRHLWGHENLGMRLDWQLKLQM